MGLKTLFISLLLMVSLCLAVCHGGMWFQKPLGFVSYNSNSITLSLASCGVSAQYAPKGY